jgi:hypothetical protein
MAKDIKIQDQIRVFEEKGGVLEYETDGDGNLIIKIKGFISQNIAYKAMGLGVSMVKGFAKNVTNIFKPSNFIIYILYMKKLRKLSRCPKYKNQKNQI